jgi:hypothetical protein
MPIILSSSDSAPLSSVMICWNIVATTVNTFFRDELFALRAWTGWLGTCWFYLKGRASPPCATVGSWNCCCCCVLLHSIALKDRYGVVWLEGNNLPFQSWEFSAAFFLATSLACLQPQCLEGWGSSACNSLWLQHVGIGALLPFTGYYVQVTAPTLHSTGRWLAVSRDIAESSVATLRETTLGLCTLLPCLKYGKFASVSIYFGTSTPYVRLLGKGDCLLWSFLLQVMMDGRYLFNANNIKAMVHQPIWDVLCRSW